MSDDYEYKGYTFPPELPPAPLFILFGLASGGVCALVWALVRLVRAVMTP